jgi:hypothetical protein
MTGGQTGDVTEGASGAGDGGGGAGGAVVTHGTNSTRTCLVTCGKL